VGDPEGRGCRVLYATPDELRDESITSLEISRQYFSPAALVLSRPDEPAVLIGCEDLLALSIPGHRDLQQWLHAVGPERCFHPQPTRAQDSMRGADQFLDGSWALEGQDARLARQTVPSSTWADVERRRLLVVERAQPLQRTATRGTERDVLPDDVL